ncbi:uncharacterized protein M6B38_356570 [Iris pallida]|uniref:Uncharacterized protein n=1 Tax=Iris pallida TaxID=29817 RepID=A0AAX6GLV0_IRIPA|nr:uncharacterized protein M6B38_356570 [Iris pallida]
MVIKNYRRSFSFPIPSSKSTTNNTAAPRINGKGSASLPCRFNPFVCQLDDEIRSLKTWRSSHSPSDPSWICEGLARLDRLHSFLLEDLLQHPQAREVLARRSACTDNLHEDFLRLADAFGSFRSAIVVLKQEQSATQAAIRRNHASRIASCLRAQKKAEKELTKIATAVSKSTANAGKSPPLSDTAELEGIVREVVAITSEVSAAAFRGIAALSSSASSSPMRAYCAVVPMLRKLSSFNKREEEEMEEENWTNASERLEALEKCLAEVEVVNEKLLRRIINTRVFLLNVLTTSL